MRHIHVNDEVNVIQNDVAKHFYPLSLAKTEKMGRGLSC